MQVMGLGGPPPPPLKNLQHPMLQKFDTTSLFLGVEKKNLIKKVSDIKHPLYYG